ncbi:thiamine/thiamine pyrophosphate ABC transporter, permease protein [Hypericibacter adhaerens]|uniref:Thiamine transport system permease protein ThiP n=1 Tax=Hypericibacter adhaerens TaxID=2602016 RepID=A0A5J6MYK9_9PROT|nr:thiamine/thiamine pyrophosphate ABC transporter, permease protein [Hypericibacter adhaerens]
MPQERVSLTTRAHTLNLPLLGGLASLVVILLLIGGAFVALLLAAADIDIGAVVGDSYIRHVVGFTVWQAALSTLLSVGLGVPVVRALARRPRFFGREGLRYLFAMPFLTPVIVAIFGLVAIYGVSGWLNRGLDLLGSAQDFHLYGLAGILIAHVFFNMPMVVTLLLPRFEAVPADSWRLAAQLGMKSGAIFRVIELPLLRQTLPTIAMLVFLLCFVSFVVVLALGGGPQATTLEVAIYQALRFDFDLGRGVSLALLQLAIGAGLFAMTRLLERQMPLMPKLRSLVARPDAAGRLGRALDLIVIAIAALFVATPLAAIVIEGILGSVGHLVSDPRLQLGTLRSLTIAGCASLLCGCLALGISMSGRQRPGRSPRWSGLLQMASVSGLVVSPLALGTGLFLLFRPVVDQPWIAYGLVVAMNAIMALPFGLRTLSQAVADAAREDDRLCGALGLSGWNRWRLIDWPKLRRPLGGCLALAFSLALGDLSAIALFGRDGMETLPLLLYQQMGAYHMPDANVTAALLLILNFACYAAIAAGVGGRARR